MKFSERMGITRASDVLQTESMTGELRNSLWNILDLHIWSVRGFQDSRGGKFGGIGNFSRFLWLNYFKLRIDSIPDYPFQIIDFIRGQFYSRAWYEVYNFIEFIVEMEVDEKLVQNLNFVLERELAGYRIISGQVAQITDNMEKEAVENALKPGHFEGSRIHLQKALEHLANRAKPDYRNSIKESISAVESIACELSGKKDATLGEALKTLEREGKLHRALKSGFSSIYGYTSDADGIRHAIMTESNIDADDAKYFLVSCAAFINYLKSKHAKST